MAETTQVALRMDVDLKAAAEKAAEASGISLTQYIHNALRAANNIPICPTCGRSSQVGYVSPGFSPPFSEFLDGLRSAGGLPYFTLITAEPDGAKVYWCRFKDARPLDGGALSVFLRTDFDQEVGEPALIPRGWLIDWKFDPEGHLYEQMILLGYLDGNDPARTLRKMRQRKGR